MGHFKKCCCSCNVGSVIQKWANTTQVIKNDSSTPPVVQTGPPYPRDDTTNTTACPNGSNTTPLVTCGPWLFGGDLHGFPTQIVNPPNDDIVAGATPDSTHATIDHNNFVRPSPVTAGTFVIGTTYKIASIGTTDFTVIGATANTVGVNFKASGTGAGTGTAVEQMDMTALKNFGGQWLLGLKNWHGRPGFIDADDPNNITGIGFNPTGGLFTGNSTTFQTSAPQLHYLQVQLTVDCDTLYYDNTPTYSTWHDHQDCTSTIDKLTGLETRSGSGPSTASAPIGTTSTYSGMPQVWTFLSGISRNSAISFFCDFGGGLTMPGGSDVMGAKTWYPSGYYWTAPFSTTGSGGLYTLTGPEDTGIPSAILVTISLNPSGGGGLTMSRSWWTWNSTTSAYYQGGYEQVSVSNTEVDYTYWDATQVPDNSVHPQRTITASIKLSLPYSSTDVQADWLAAKAAWNMSDLTVAKLRLDEQLANAPLCCYDEIGPVQPAPSLVVTMDDYSATQNGNGSWRQRAWLDTNGFVWIYHNVRFGQGIPPAGFTGGATMLTPTRSGEIISHLPAGTDKFQWFGFRAMTRSGCGVGGVSWCWDFNGYGFFADSILPMTTQRWMDKNQAQYDAVAEISGNAVHLPGNYPMAFLTQYGSMQIGGSFVQATQTWPSINRARPCGTDKFAVDQTTVCGINTGTGAGGSFTVTPSSTSAAPGAPGGIIAGDTIAVEGDGIYPVSSISGGAAPYTVNVGAKIGPLPLGWTINECDNSGLDGKTHIGRLRWPSASGICGRAAVTATWAAGTLTITSAVAIPTLLKSTAADTLPVDLYDASMTSGTKVSAAQLTRVSDTSWAATMISAPAITVAYMTGAGVDWTLYSTTPQRTGFKLEWTFNLRTAQIGYPSPPTFYGAGSTEFPTGIAGCTALTATPFTYPAGCPSLVGIVPSSSPETLSVRFGFPSINFDDTFGAYGCAWLATINLTQADPFWQKPFLPDCDGVTRHWNEDDGSGNRDDTATTPPTLYFPHHPLVEASGDSSHLPAGIYAAFDLSHNVVPPPYFPSPINPRNGIPIGDNSGGYGSIEMDWGFAYRVCGNHSRFVANYTYVQC